METDDVQALATTGAQIRAWIVETPFPSRLEKDIFVACEKMLPKAEVGNISVAVHSSAITEDLVDASFAGQQETFLNVQGLDNLLKAIKEVFASLYNDRAISYRVHKGFQKKDRWYFWSCRNFN